MGKSFRLGFLLRTEGIGVGPALDFLASNDLTLICCLFGPAGRPFLGNRLGKANMEREANKIVEATKIIPVVPGKKVHD